MVPHVICSEIALILRWEFNTDSGSRDIYDQYMLGSKLLVAPVTKQNATSRLVYFPKGAHWVDFWRPSSPALDGGVIREVHAPLEVIPVYWRID